MVDKDLKNEGKSLFRYYRRNKRKILKNFACSFLFFFLACFFVGTKLFYPYHFLIAIIFLPISLVFFVRIFLFQKQKVKKSIFYQTSKKIAKVHKIFFFSLFILIILIYVFLKIFPIDDNPFINMSDNEVKNLIFDDEEKALVLMDIMELVSENLLKSGLLDKEELDADEREKLKKLWDNYLLVFIETEKVTDVHRYFNKLSILNQGNERARSFMIAYSLYIKKYKLFYNLMQKVNDNEFIEKILNEKHSVIDNNQLYIDIENRFYSSEILLRENLGQIYFVFTDIIKKDENFGENYLALKREAKDSYQYLLKNVDSSMIKLFEAKTDKLERSLFRVWFPIQKNTANLMGNIYISSRHKKLVTIEQIQKMEIAMEPGDILIERRNWYVSNIGIPGFWPHAALYLGNYQKAQEYFQELFPLDGYVDFEALIKSKYPKVFEKYITQDENNYDYAVIEGKAPGIILQSLEESARADYVGVMRPRLTKKDKLLAILRAFDNYGKPYDYNFDFETKDEFVCSELVYDAYLATQEKKGLDFELNFVGGRKIISPTDFVKKYYEERDEKTKQLDFVYFLDGNESLQKAFVKDENEFMISWTRPKYDFIQE